MHTIQIIGLRNRAPTPFDGQWLVEYDPDQRGVDPEGEPMLAHVVTTPDRANARLFEDAADAMHEWQRVSKTWPVRQDGKPNRPLAAFTVQISPLQESTGSSS